MPDPAATPAVASTAAEATPVTQAADASPVFDMARGVARLSDSLFPQPEPSNATDPKPAPGVGAGSGSNPDGSNPAPAGKPDAVAGATPAEGTPAVGGVPSGATPATPAAIPPPKSWSAAAQSEWSKLPAAAQAEVAKREEDFHRGLEQYREGAQVGRRFNEIVSPYLPTLRQFNADPMQVIERTLQTHHQLATGSQEQRHAAFQELAKGYGIDLTRIAEQVAAAPFETPETRELRERVARMESDRTAERAAADRKIVEEHTAKVQAFTTDPKNIHLATVGQSMVAMLAADKALSLEQAYEAAVMLNPVTRKIEQDRLFAEANAKRDADEADRVAKARASSGAYVYPNGAEGRPTAPLGTMEDTMRETLRNIKSRDLH